jgi:flagellar hook-length control protein FliK
MPKVPNATAPAPKPAVPKPAKGPDTTCGVNEFKCKLADARKKDDAAAPPDANKTGQAGKPKRAKTEAAAKTKPGAEDSVDAPSVDETGSHDVGAEPVAEEFEAGIVAETTDQDQPVVVSAKTEQPSAASVALTVPTQTIAIAEYESAATSGEENDASELPATKRPPQNVPAETANATTEESPEMSPVAVPTALIEQDAGAVDEPVDDAAPAAPAMKRATKPAPPAAAAPVTEAEDNPRTEPEAVPASLASLEQTVATFEAPQPAPASATTTDGTDPVIRTVPLTPPQSGTERTAARLTSNAITPEAPAPVSVQSFADVNHPKIVTSVRGELLPSGGTMQIRLDPPELGALQVLVHMRDGAMTASFQTSNDDATKLLSHSLGQLKQVLESQGVSVDKLHVQQAPRDQQASNNSDDQRQQQHAREDESARHEQQRKEMLRRMWRRLSGNPDPLDLVA